MINVLTKYWIVASLCLVPLLFGSANSTFPPGNYRRCPPANQPPPAINFNNNQTYVDPQGSYFPIGSPEFALITSSLYNDKATLDDMRQLGCYRVRFTSTIDRQTTAFRTTMPMKCVQFSPPKWISTCTFSPPNTDYDHVNWITMSDNKSFGVVARCWKGKYFTWNVFSTKPRLAPELQTAILNHVATLGFDKTKFVNLDYTHCCAC